MTKRSVVGGAVAALLAMVIVVIWAAGCGGRTSGDPGGIGVSREAISGAGSLSTASLSLQVRTASCVANQVQDFFQITNTGSTPVALSDVSVRFWADDTSGQALSAQIFYGGCVTSANGTCVHPVSGVTASATPLSLACGPDPTHQANWELAISTNDSATLPPGSTWSNVQSSVNLAGYANFSPGTADWYSSCLTGSNFASSPHFGVYYQGNLVFSNGVAAPDCRAPHGSQTLSGYLTCGQLGAPVVGPVAPPTTIQLAVGLPLQNEGALAALATAVSDPTSPSYRQYLTPAALAATYGPLQATYDALSAWAQTHGLSVSGTFPNRVVLDVQGTAAAVEQALFASLVTCSRPDGTQFYALDRQPSLSFANAVQYIAGLNNFAVPRPKMSFIGAGTIVASDLRSAYLGACASDTTTYSGNNQCIGFFEGATYDINDINKYFSTYLGSLGLPSPSVTAVSVNKFNTNAAPPGDFTTVEVEGDIEVALTMAPRAAMRVYETNYTSDTDVVNVINSMATDTTRCNQLSMSWALESNATVASLLTKVLPVQGQSFFLASGDWGAYPTGQLDSNVKDEANFITWTGGTVLTKSGSAYNESAWSFGGSGPVNSNGNDIVGTSGNSAALPVYQAALAASNPKLSGTFRNVPDVVSEADTEITLVATSPADGNFPFDGQCGFTRVPAQTIAIGGTSLAAPVWAGVMALANERSAANGLAPVGFLNPVLYALGQSSLYSSTMRDIQTGTVDNYPISLVCNSVASGNDLGAQFSAATGFDPATGWGSPTCGLIRQLALPAPLKPNLTLGVGEFDACAVLRGFVFCWGANSEGELGDGTTIDRNVPVQVPGLSGVTSVSPGLFHSCALLGNGTAQCWGNNDSGQLGDGTTTSRLKPAPVAGLSNAIAISAGDHHTCALLAAGGVVCWGEDGLGELGDGTMNPNPVTAPVAVKGITNAVEVRAGASRTCAVLSTGALECWGDNENGALGDGTTMNQGAPVPVHLSGSAVAVGVGDQASCAVLSNGGAECWGVNGSGTLGDNKAEGVRGTPVPVQGLAGATAIAVGSSQACAVVAGGAVQCWGDNLEGDVGDGTAVERDVPANVTGLAGPAVDVEVGGGFSCALLSSGGVECWGENGLGNLGDGSNAFSLVPVAVQF